MLSSHTQPTSSQVSSSSIVLKRTIKSRESLLNSTISFIEENNVGNAVAL
uniref:Uncharacterized protein n=1 Tax=Nelumbo nucifera TaxID=4432 RepID=A0A822ZUP0_NELNU|nr:TPA_asm: hypothetical protein HUJ06_017167 [Nelumbo nucifera]